MLIVDEYLYFSEKAFGSEVNIFQKYSLIKQRLSA